MPKRPRSHALEEFSRNRLHDLFTQIGWVVWDLHPDYGEDLLVRIFQNETATHYSFFIQAKATDHIETYMHRDGKSLSYPIKVDHIKYWSQFWEPVILTVWDAKLDVTYWELIQDYMDHHKGDQYRKKSLRIDLPLDNILNEEGLKRIVVRTKARFSRFEREREGAQVLVDILEEELKVKIEYDPHYGFISLHRPVGGTEIFGFGKFHAVLSRMASKYNLSEQEVLSKGLRELAYSNVPPSTLDDLLRMWKREEELREYEEDT